MEFSAELIAKARACKSAEELVALAKENGIEFDLEDAQLIIDDYVEGELADDELDNVAGGGCAKPGNPYENITWDRKEDVQFIFNVGDRVEAFAFGCEHHTATCKVVNRSADSVTSCVGGAPSVIGYADYYWLEKEPGVKSVFAKGWYRRSDIER